MIIDYTKCSFSIVFGVYWYSFSFLGYIYTYLSAVKKKIVIFMEKY